MKRKLRSLLCLLPVFATLLALPWVSAAAETRFKDVPKDFCACVLFATFFNTSCQVLPDDGLPAETAKALSTLADQVAPEGKSPW